ncbi:hypothetical protein HHX47_DHR1001552 [Lentinula edodes]|nr:hypothetical protein HHX47_DHR1001552 [Lentinula edodes]
MTFATRSNSTTFNGFEPTPESIPPPYNELRLKLPSNLPVNYHPLNPLEFLLRAALIYPDKLAVVHPDVKTPAFYTYSVWTQRVQNLGYALVKAGLKPGDRIAVIAPNVPMMADALQGALAARVILTAINTRLTPQEVAYILEHSGSKLILIDSEYLHLIEGTRIPFVVSNDSGNSGDPYERFLSEGRQFSGEKGWSGLEMEADENAPAMLCYTQAKGIYPNALTLTCPPSSNGSKGVLTTLRGTYLAALANAFEGQMNANSTYLWILPMFHAAGWTFPWANTFAFTTQITMRSVDYPLIWKHFLHSRVTHYCGAPTVQIGIVNDPAAKRPPQQIRAYIAGAAPTAHLIGHPFVTAGGMRVVYRAEESPDPNGELVDVPKDGKTMGEIVTRGNIVMKEYFNDVEATNKAFRGGYFGSGDLAVMHPDGSASILDRSKDIIISGGENASSLAIEQELASHPHILEVSVVAREHKKWGERPMAFVTLHPQHASKWKGRHEDFARDLKAHAKKRLPGFACPEWVEIVPELPKTSTGKILKAQLRKVVAKL